MTGFSQRTLFDPLVEREARASLLSIAIEPRDRFDGKLVGDGVTAIIPDQLAQARRSLDGHLVFVNLAPAERYRIEVDGRDGGYVGPLTTTFERPPAGPRPWESLRKIVWLTRRPEAVPNGVITVLRGQLLMAGKPAADRRITGKIMAKVPPPAATPSQPPSRDDVVGRDGAETETASDVRGVFALPLHPPVITSDIEPKELLAEITFIRESEPSNLVIIRPVGLRSTHVFALPIDLADSQASVPPFAET